MALVLPAMIAALFSVDVKEIIIFVTWVTLVMLCVHEAFSFASAQQPAVEMMRQVGGALYLAMT